MFIEINEYDVTVNIYIYHWTMTSLVNVTSMYFKKINLSLLWKLQRRDDRGQHTTTTATTRFLRRMIYVILFVFSDVSVCYCPRPLPCGELYIRFVFYTFACLFVCLRQCRITFGRPSPLGVQNIRSTFHRGIVL